MKLQSYYTATTRGILSLPHPSPPFPRRVAARRGVVTPYSFPQVSIEGTLYDTNFFELCFLAFWGAASLSTHSLSTHSLDKAVSKRPKVSSLSFPYTYSFTSFSKPSTSFLLAHRSSVAYFTLALPVVSSLYS
jgi:hypothetical protein